MAKSKDKDIKTNAMRILESKKIAFEVNTYECDEFTDGLTVAEKNGQNPEQSYKTLVTEGKSKNYFVFVIPIAEELDLKKAAKSVGEKSVEMIHVKDINKITGYIRGGCSPLGMKKQFVTVVDDSAKNHDKIIISGGRIGSQIILAPDDLLKAINGKYDDITKK
jgi:Cys-tRNA(Pro)/Cys-tRNA(Cys) deacylase